MRLRHPYNPHTQASEVTALLRFRREGGKNILRGTYYSDRRRGGDLELERLPLRKEIRQVIHNYSGARKAGSFQYCGAFRCPTSWHSHVRIDSHVCRHIIKIQCRAYRV
jgi:hypothetical protein